MKNKTIFVQAHFINKTGFFGGDKPTDKIDAEKLNNDLQLEVSQLNADGYKVLSITPITSGNDNFRNGVGYGYGYGYTDGLIILAEKYE